MTDLEVVASLLMQIRNLQARIDSADDDSLTWEEEEQLRYLEDRLAQTKGGRYAYPCKLRV